MDAKTAVKWVLYAFVGLLVFLLLSQLPIPTLQIEKGQHTERVSVPSLPTMVELTITLREESREKDFSALDERLEEIKDYVSNYSVMPSLYSYKDEKGNTYYVLTYTIKATMEVDEVALKRIVALADSLRARFLQNEKELEQKALNASRWEPEGFLLKYEKEASCSRYGPVPLYKAEAVEGLQPREEEVSCSVVHRYERMKVEWQTVYNLLRGLLRR